MSNVWGKTASTGVAPSGLYSAKVADVDGDDVYVTVPKLSNDFVHGPIIYSGAVPEVGDEALVGFLEGDKDSVVAIFPGGGTGGPPVEPTYLIASYEAMDEVKAISDYVCDGVNDEEELNEIVRQSGDKVIQFTGGTFNLEGKIYRGYGSYDSLTWRGVGKYETLLYFEDVGASSWAGVIDFHYYIGDFRLYDLGITWYFNYNDLDNIVLPPVAVITGRHIELYDVDLTFEDLGADYSDTPLDHTGTFGLDIESIIMLRCDVWTTGSFIDIYPYSTSNRRFISENWILAYGYVIDTHTAPDVVIENNYMQSWEYAEFVIRAPGTRTRISGNYISARDANEIDETPICVITGRWRGVVTNNLFQSSWGAIQEAGVVESYGTGAIVSNNVFWSSNGGPCINLQGNYSVANDNIFYSPAAEAIKAHNFYDASINNNHIIAAAYDGPAFSFYDAAKIVFSNNSVDNTEYVPVVKVDNCWDIVISNFQADMI